MIILNGIKIEMEIIDHNFGLYFPQDTKERDIYTCRLKANNRQYTFKFGQSLAKHGVEPELKDVLECFTWYNPNSFEDFCKDYGYNNDPISAYKIYKSVMKEYKALLRMFGSEETLIDLADAIFNGE